MTRVRDQRVTAMVGHDSIERAVQRGDIQLRAGEIGVRSARVAVPS
jgi:hypothetical protein